MMRSSALSLALGYVALGIAALVLFAAPLYDAWQVTIQDGRSEILQADALRLTDVYRREGGDGLKNFIDARINMQIAGDRILLLTDSSLKPLAGNLAAWPRGLPAAAGNYRIKVDLAEHGIQTSLVHVTQLGDYVLLVGRDNKLFAPLERRFWYGLIAAIAVLSIACTAFGKPCRPSSMAISSIACPPIGAKTSSARCRAPSTACSIRSSSSCTGCATSRTPSRTICARRSRSCARVSRSSR